MFAGVNVEARRAYAKAGMLYKLHLDLLYQCDLECEHCYLDDKKRRILPTDFWLGVLDQAAAMGVFTVTFSGGEIFLRKDLFTLIAHARSVGLFVHLKSHGGYIDPPAAARLASLGVSSVALSYYASDPAIHDAITRHAGSHAKTRAALEHLSRAGILTVASCVVMQRNRDAWRTVIAECDALGVFTNLDGHMLTAQSGAAFPHDLAVEHGDAIDLQRHLFGRFGLTESTEAFSTVASAAVRAQWGDQTSCGAAHTSLYVSPEGSVTPCVQWPQPLGNLANGTRLADLWRSPSGQLADLRKIRARDRVLCSTCEVREHCDFCAGQSFITTGNPTEAIAHICVRTRIKTLARAAALGLPDPPLPAGLRDADPAQTAPPAAALRRFTVRAAPRT